MNLYKSLLDWCKKKKKPFNDMGFISDAVFPHCDQRVLHAPGECQYCDHYPHYQELRKAWGINFTGQTLKHDPEFSDWKLLPCPSDFNRGVAGAHVWGGNRPRKP